MTLGNLPPTYISTDNAVFALKTMPRPVRGVTLNKNDVTLPIDSTEQLTATVLPANATNQNVSWQSSAPAVASVVDGLVTAITKGTAIITVTTEDGGYTAQCVVIVENGSGIVSTSLNNQISIYPNPVKDKLKIESGDLQSGTKLKINSVEITDLAGRIIVNYSLLIVNYIDVSTLPQGMYLLKIYTDKGVVTKKFVKN